jgi:outer membrane protein OmpA-like peptidoglycan-associated protein
VRGILFVLPSLYACATGASLSLEAETIQEQLNTAREAGAYLCAPRELATAEAHLEFLLSELDQGNAVRAAQHRTTAREALVTVLDKAKGCLPKDRDGDGIIDSADQCPDTPGLPELAGCPDRDGDRIADHLDKCVEVPEDFDGNQDEDGCPETEDRDGDGVFDPEDACPDQPGPAKNRGCPIGDRDGDGLLDDDDKCPDDPEDKDKFEDEDGCPDPDNDADGILDVSDECPLEPETKNGVDDEDGCPDVKLELVEVRKDIGKIEIKQKVYFDTGKATIKSISFELLNQVAQAIQSNAGMTVLVEGHTDSVGSNTFNMGLSQRRADSVRDYLVRQGVDGDRLTAIGFGEEKPIDSNQTRDGREKNRRVEFTITKQ